MKAKPNKSLLIWGILLLIMTFRPMLYTSFGWFDTSYTKLTYEANTSYSEDEIKIQMARVSGYDKEELEVSISDGLVEIKMPAFDPSMSPMIQSRAHDLLENPVRSASIKRSMPFYYKNKTGDTVIEFNGYLIVFLIGLCMVITYMILNQKDRYLKVE